jgi:V8-like Glu-specific endopeptidase
VSLKVTHTFGRNAGAVQTLDKPVVRFGRAPDCDVVFDPDYDRDASTHHAEARFEGGAWVLNDLGSRNGTFLRGQRVTRETLRSGDEITFGTKGPRVRVDLEGGAPAQAPRVIVKGSTVPMPVAGGAAPAPAPAPAAPKPAAQLQAATDPAGPMHAAPAPYHAPAPAPQHAPAPHQAPAPHRAPAPQQAPAPSPYAPGPVGHAAGAPPVAPPAGKRVGQRTMAMMISSAVAAARGRSHQPSTQELSAYVDRQVGAATADQRRTSAMLGCLLLVALAGLGGLIVWSSRSNDDIDKLRSDLAKLPPDDPRRKDIEGRLGSLHPSNATFGRNLYDQSRKGIFMLASGGQGFCTAFAVRPNVLASNAHCVFAAKRMGGRITAFENEGKGQKSFSVSDMKAHPSYRDADATALTPDVGIFTISGTAAIVLNVATQAELAGSGAGDDVYMIGFPGRLMDSSNPAATFLAAHVGRITNAQGRPGAYAENWLIQHDAPTTPGTSGSPIFNGRGKVIAINAGGYLEGDDETIAGRKTEVVKASPYKFGMRIDLLDAILR